MRRLVGSVALVVITALAAEGLASLATGSGFLRRMPELLRGRAAPAPPPLPAARGRGEGLFGTPGNPGPFWLHQDPRVGIVLRPSARMAFARGLATTDALGLRRRPGGEPAVGAPRIVVLGASIPFGYGLGDRETLAHRLEGLLAGVWAGPGPPPACRTVAVPRWSHRNAVHFLLDHWRELDPDIVLYMPFSNDMADTPIVTTDGYRRAWPDPFNPRPLAPVDQDQTRKHRARLLEQLGRDPAALAGLGLGPQASTSDLSPESWRRYDENAESIALLARHLEARGRKLALLRYRDSAHGWHLLRRLHDRGLEPPQIAFFRTIEPGFRLPWDGHPNAETTRVMALWTARALVELGWLGAPASDGELPEAPGKYRRQRSARRAPAEVARLSRKHREQALRELGDRVSFETWQGLLQVYGGIGLGVQATTGLTLLLKAGGRELTVRLRGLDEEEGVEIYPLRVVVEAGGAPLGTLEVGSGELAEGRFSLPPEIPRGSAFEVRLVPERWGLLEWEGISQTASFYPLEVAAPPDGEQGSE